MGLIRREIHKAEVNALADRLRAIAHPARLALLRRIAQSNNCICTDLSEDLGLAQATVSQHLKILRDAGIIRGAIAGNAVCYCIDRVFMRSLKRDFLKLADHLDSTTGGGRC